MPRKQSAGLLMYREGAGGLEVLLVHPGGPFWVGKEEGAWSIPKGEFGDGEAPLQAAKREFEEETGVAPPGGALLPLAPVRQRSGKIIHAWALRGDFAVAALRSNVFSLEWPPHLGRREEFPEVDRAAWFSVGNARRKITKGQLPLLDELERHLAEAATGAAHCGAPTGWRKR